jgi:hypothetical protein
VAHDIRANLNALIEGLQTGKTLEVFDKYYADDVVMSENAEEDPKRIGKAANRAYEAYFVEHAQWHGARIGRVTVDVQNNTSAYEMWMDLTFLGQRMQRTQTAVQTWRDGRIVQETFYYKA